MAIIKKGGYRPPQGPRNETPPSERAGVSFPDHPATDKGNNSMSEATTNETVPDAATTIVPTGDVVPVAEGQEPPAPRITEEERAQLSEAVQELRAASNGYAALKAEEGRLDAERRVAEAKAETAALLGQQLEAAVQQKLQLLTQQYNIPEGWTIDSKTGLIAEPSAEDAATQPQPTA